jgi:hypothetical protein
MPGPRATIGAPERLRDGLGGWMMLARGLADEVGCSARNGLFAVVPKVE